MTRQIMQKGNRGATALLIVLFATLLFSVITIGFLGLMISDQRRAVDSEWSEAAYDSALAGVEDGKRVLAMCQSDPTSPACAAISAQECDTIARAQLVSETNGEVLLQSVGGSGLAGESVNQAYTCVIVQRDTPSYLGHLENDESVLIPLDSGGEAYTQVVLSWFTLADSQTGVTFGPGGTSLPTVVANGSNWEATRPPIMRTQFMQYDSTNIELDNFDKDTYAHTAFLYPAAAGLNTMTLFASDKRDPGDVTTGSAKNAPFATRCVNTNLEFGYACTMVVNLPDIAGPAVSPANRAALLRITALYGATSYRIQMRNSSGETVNFVNTQPSIDSTGRAGDVFRRVDARIDMTGSASDVYPRATVDVTDDLCKNFSLGASDTTWRCDLIP